MNFFLWQESCTQAKLTVSICYEDWFRKCSKISAILVNTSKSAKNKVFLTLLVFDENLTNPEKMKSNKTDLGNLSLKKSILTEKCSKKQHLLVKIDPCYYIFCCGFTVWVIL